MLAEDHGWVIAAEMAYSGPRRCREALEQVERDPLVVGGWKRQGRTPYIAVAPTEENVDLPIPPREQAAEHLEVGVDSAAAAYFSEVRGDEADGPRLPRWPGHSNH
jgi:hypothetical protein